MPTITLTLDTLKALGVRPIELLPGVLPPQTVQILEPTLVAHGFDMTRDVQIVVLAAGGGVVLTE